MTRKWTVLVIGLILGVSIMAAACSSQPDPVEPLPSQGLPLDPNRGVRPETPFEPGPDESQKEPGTISPPPISIIDTIDADECNLIHSINACFTDGQPPEGVSLSEYMDLYFLARDNLAERFDFNPLTIKISEIKKVQWNDSSLGNPEPGMFYTQAIVPGYRLELESNGATYTYHTSEKRVSFVK